MGKVNRLMSIYQIVTKARDTSQNEYRNVQHFEFPGYVPSNTEIQDAIDDLDTSYKANLQTLIRVNVEFYEYDVRRVDVGNLPAIPFQPTAGGWFGTNNANLLPRQVAPLISFKSLTAYPRNARTYLFGFTEDSSAAGGTLEPTSKAAIEQYAFDSGSLNVNGNTNALRQAVQYGGTPRVVVANNEVTSFIVRDDFATQRRRVRGVGI